MDTGCSGFDSYFIALARIKDAMLLTDDGRMHFHAKEVSVDAVLIREVDFKGIKTKIQIPKSLSLFFWFDMPLLPISEELHFKSERK